jgi:hypothetical protein
VNFSLPGASSPSPPKWCKTTEPSSKSQQPFPGRADGDGGRGLRLMQEYAGCWGGRPLGDGLLDRGAGKSLWFEVGG